MSSCQVLLSNNGCGMSYVAIYGHCASVWAYIFERKNFAWTNPLLSTKYLSCMLSLYFSEIKNNHTMISAHAHITLLSSPNVCWLYFDIPVDMGYKILIWHILLLLLFTTCCEWLISTHVLSNNSSNTHKAFMINSPINSLN